jgi:hypothetical protein
MVYLIYKVKRRDVNMKKLIIGVVIVAMAVL